MLKFMLAFLSLKPDKIGIYVEEFHKKTLIAKFTQNCRTQNPNLCFECVLNP